MSSLLPPLRRRISSHNVIPILKRTNTAHTRMPDASQLSFSTKKHDEYDSEDHQHDYYVTTKVVYRTKEVHSVHSHASCHIGGLSGTEHTCSLSGFTLTVNETGVGKRAGYAQSSTVDLSEKCEKEDANA